MKLPPGAGWIIERVLDIDFRPTTVSAMYDTLMRPENSQIGLNEG